jgi:hypothetical protein
MPHRIGATAANPRTSKSKLVLGCAGVASAAIEIHCGTMDEHQAALHRLYGARRYLQGCV